mmetsp:Transcript_9148/g.21957  ORF Transcript_9148/g.21957 Transcript_9148/m.21957 type:complete len:202 (+) Transcript_9148:928-1533(+)
MNSNSGARMSNEGFQHLSPWGSIPPQLRVASRHQVHQFLVEKPDVQRGHAVEPHGLRQRGNGFVHLLVIAVLSGLEPKEHVGHSCPMGHAQVHRGAQNGDHSGGQLIENVFVVGVVVHEPQDTQHIHLLQNPFATGQHAAKDDEDILLALNPIGVQLFPDHACLHQTCSDKNSLVFLGIWLQRLIQCDTKVHSNDGVGHLR